MNTKLLQWGVAALGVVALAITVFFFWSGNKPRADAPSLVATAGNPAGSATPAAAAGPATPGGPIPEVHIAVIDRQAVMRLSAAGKSMVTGVQALQKSSEDEFRAAATALAKEKNDLDQQGAILSAAIRQEKQKELANKQASLQKRIQDRELEIQTGFTAAGRELDSKLGPILDQLMKERGANVLLERGSVLLSTVDIDLSGEAIKRLDAALPTIKVALVKPTPEEAAAMRQQMQQAAAAGTP